MVKSTGGPQGEQRDNAQPKASRKPRGRPRSEQARKAILKSAYDLLTEQGVARLTIEAVAARAGVGKPTIYRSWSNARELAMAALLAEPDSETTVPQTDVPESDAPIQDLTRQVCQVISIFATLRGRQVTQMMAAAEPDSELSKAFRNQIILKCREDGRTILHRAQTKNLVRTPLDIDLVLDLIYGPIFYRLLAGHEKLSEQTGREIVELVIRGVESPA